MGCVERLGTSVTRLHVDDRVGVGRTHLSSGGPDEYLSVEFRATGRNANGGYAEYMVAPRDYAYPIPDVLSDAEAAPLPCPGAIGYRTLRLSRIADG